MTDKQIIGGRGSAKPFTTLNSINLMLEIDDLKEALKTKEQECEELREQLAEMILQSALLPKFFGLTADEITNMLNQLDQLKAEVKSKTEYIQEQRDIINQYSKEIEMYKKCQGKRASKREEELKAENDKLKTENKRFKETLDELFKIQYKLADNCKKLRQCLTEIKEIAITGLEGFCPKCSRKECEDNNCIETAIREILQKISEVENEED